MFQTNILLLKATILTGDVDISTEGYFAFLKSLIIPGRLCVVGSELMKSEQFSRRHSWLTMQNTKLGLSDGLTVRLQGLEGLAALLYYSGYLPAGLNGVMKL